MMHSPALFDPFDDNDDTRRRDRHGLYLARA